MSIQRITSSTNPLLKEIKRLVQNNSAYKLSGHIWLEGEHLCEAYFEAAMTDPEMIHQIKTAVISNSSADVWLPVIHRIENYIDIVLVADSLFAQISELPSSGGVGLLLNFDSIFKPPLQPRANTLILDGVQDAGNVGSILRSAAAFGVDQILAIQGTAAIWSGKVLRAGMGAHFSLDIVESLTAEDIRLSVPLLATHVHDGRYLHELQAENKIPYPCAWIMGHEGQGVSQALLDKASYKVRIDQRGQESLNVAAAASVCLYASMACDS